MPEHWDRELRLADAPDLDVDPNVVRVSLEARLADIEWKPGIKTTMWTFNGSVPGPTIRAKRGDRVIIEFRNALPEPTIVHWHGIRLPNAMDGTELVQAPVLPGGTFTYDFVVPDAGIYWYHPHQRSGPQLSFGLYGALIVEDPAAPQMGDKLDLVASDLALDASGQLKPGDDNGWFGDYFGREGDTLLLNGKSAPQLRVTADEFGEWRVVNAMRAQFLRMRVPSATVLKIGADGGRGAAPVPVNEILLAPGERGIYLLKVPSSAGASVAIERLHYDRYHVGYDPDPVPWGSIEVIGNAHASGWKAPSKLVPIDAPNVTGAPVRSLSLDEIVPANGSGSHFVIAGAGIDASGMMMAKKNSVEVWEIRNTTTMDHPMHLHGFFFYVLSPHPNDVIAWRDTVNLLPNQTLRIAIPFDGRVGSWMLHCHILDHSDAGMMTHLMLH